MVLFLIILMIIGAALVSLGIAQAVQSRKYAFKNPKLAQSSRIAHLMIGAGAFFLLITFWYFSH